jgi:transposase-like protein
MDWPKTPVERLQAFRPPFCPSPDCPEHHRRDGRFRFHFKGSYPTRRSDHNQRFRCLSCGATFSERAFSPRYFLKRPELLLPVAAGLVAGSAHRQIARSLGCSPSTVTRLSARIGRHTLLLMGRALAALRGRLAEGIVFDHFETFEFAQDFPFGIATPVGAASWFVVRLRGRSRPPCSNRTPVTDPGSAAAPSAATTEAGRLHRVDRSHAGQPGATGGARGPAASRQRR